MSNIEIKCVDCGNPFYFTDRDQAFYQEKGYQQPKRCVDCRRIKKQQMESRGPRI